MEYNAQEIILPDGFEALVRRVEELLARQGRVLTAIDGRCGSGKSTLSALLAARWDCTLVHADDFFLRPEQRTPQRLAQPGGNFDRERFEAEVLAPLREGRDALYRPYDCHAGRLKEPVAAPCRPVVLAEGSYTCHPDCGPATTCTSLSPRPWRCAWPGWPAAPAWTWRLSAPDGSLWRSLLCQPAPARALRPGAGDLNSR